MMDLLFATTYCALSLMVLGASWVAARSLQGVLLVGDDAEARRPVPFVRMIKEMRLRKGGRLTGLELQGNASVLIFAPLPEELDPTVRRMLQASVLGIRSKVPGKIIVIVDERPPAAWTAELDAYDQLDRVCTVVDELGAVEQQCKIKRKPAAIEFDSAGRYVRSGTMARW